MPPDLELTARVYNINEGHNRELVEKNETLRGYVLFIAKVREIERGLYGGKRAGDVTRDERKRIMKRAITGAVRWCIANNILRGFLEKNASEVINMLFDEWKLEDALVVEREEGREERGSEITGLSAETIQNLADR
ncbi:MAG: hypothetical protein LBF74_12185, partial [Treponema sp.]|jgi:hypothetical protein|nr:hypothetical protein [Treponema sp.]